MKIHLGFAAWALCIGSSANAVLFADNFDVDSSANWTVNKSTTLADSSASFAYDYSLLGIPSAPNSGGTTLGLKMDANTSGGVFSGLSVSPTGQSFAGDFELRADVWLNFVGPFPAGGSGSTQAGGMGIGTAGTTAQWAGGVQDSIHFGATTDGNSSADWRAYSSAAGSGYGDASTVFAAAGAGNRNHSHPYYAGFGKKMAPAAQLALYPTQTGETLVGSAGFAWHDMRVKKTGNLVTWTVSGVLIATVDASTTTLGGSNILLNYYDTNASSSSSPNKHLNCIVFDNVQVVPEPATFLLLGAGLAGLLRRRAK